MPPYVKAVPVPPPKDIRDAFPLKRWIGDSFLYEIDSLLMEGAKDTLKALVDKQNPEEFLIEFAATVSDQHEKLMHSLQAKTLGFAFSATGIKAVLFALRNAIFERIFYHLANIGANEQDSRWLKDTYAELQKVKKNLMKELIKNGEVENSVCQGKLIYRQNEIVGVVEIPQNTGGVKKTAINILIIILVYAQVFEDERFFFNISRLAIITTIISALYLIVQKFFWAEESQIYLKAEILEQLESNAAPFNNNFPIDVLFSTVDERHPFWKSILNNEPASPSATLTSRRAPA